MKSNSSTATQAAPPARPVEQMTAEQHAEANLRARHERRQQREAEMEGRGRTSNGADVPIRHDAGLGIPEEHAIGRLRLKMVAPVLVRSTGFEQALYSRWPDVFMYAVLADRYGKGINLDATATYWTGVRVATVKAIKAELLRTQKAQTALSADSENASAPGDNPGDNAEETEAEEDTKTDPALQITRQDVLEQIAGLTKQMARYSATAEADRKKAHEASVSAALRAGAEVPGDFEPNALDVVCDTVWEVARGHNNGLTREALPELLCTNLSTSQFADLLRAVMNCADGADVEFTGSLASVFGPPSDAA